MAGFANSINVPDGDVGTIPIEFSQEVISEAIKESIVFTCGTRGADMTTRQANTRVLEQEPTAYFVSQDTNDATSYKQTSDAVWGDERWFAEEVAVLIPVFDATIDDAGIPIWDELRTRLVQAFGKVLDPAVLYGTNAPATWLPNGLVGAAITAGNVASLAAFPDLWDALLGPGGVASLVEEDGFMITKWVAHTSMMGQLRNVRTSDGMPIFQLPMQADTDYRLIGREIFFPMNGTIDPLVSLMITGDWTKLIYRVRQQLTFRIFDSGVITDPATGLTTFNAMQQDARILRAVMRIAYAIPNPVTCLNPDVNTRYPFAVLAP